MQSASVSNSLTRSAWEPEVADMTANARAGMNRISEDLTFAGYNTPASMAIMWSDGGGTPAVPDELTILYADPDIPSVRPMCGTSGGGGGGGKGGGKGGCGGVPPCSPTIKNSFHSSSRSNEV